MSRILVFSPYAMRPHLTAYEGTIAKGCQVRGAEVEYLLCDGLLPECDMHWDSFGKGNFPRPADLCQRCQAGAAREVGALGVPFRWLSAFVNVEERARAQAWAQGLARHELQSAIFTDRPLGEWVLSSVVSYFRQYPPDLTDGHVEAVYRGFLTSAAIVAVALDRYLAANAVDAALLFNGRQSVTRVAFEMFRARGIRELIHEYPFFRNEHLLLKPDARCWSPAPFKDFWDAWGQVPLSRASLEKTRTWLMDRRYGKGLSWYAFNRPHIRHASVREQLKLSPNKRLLALFTSSTDEIAGDPELQGPYESQTTWVHDVVGWVKDREDVELVIRVHPNLSGDSGLGRAVEEFEFYRQLKSALPANLRVVMPDDPLNSYALMDAADVGLTYVSAVGLEMAMLGKPVVLASRAFYEHGSHVITMRPGETLAGVMERSLQSYSAREIRREAFRMAYYYVFEFELPFPLVSKTGVFDVKLNYTGEEELLPGRDRTLDHACRFLIEGTSLFDAPTDAELVRTTADEDAFLSEMEGSPAALRDVGYERRVRRTDSFNRLGRSVQSALSVLPFGSGNLLATAGKLVHRKILRRFEQRD